jgi:asparagine synthase (glutamine-hydrolysing)
MRVPFLDVELMRWVERIRGRERVGLRAGKKLHRRAVEGLVPREALERPKHGFSTPYDRWLHTSLGEEMRRRTEDESLAGLLAPAEVRRLVDDHLAHRADHKRLLYALLELATWHRAFLSGGPAGGPVTNPTSVAAG